MAHEAPLLQGRVIGTSHSSKNRDSGTIPKRASSTPTPCTTDCPHCAYTGDTRLTKRMSFDSDGTLAGGDPPGIITLDMMRLTHTRGALIGRCSDRTTSDQQPLRAQHNMRIACTVLQHQLADVKVQCQTEAHAPLGETDMDHCYATRAGFRCLKAETTTCQPWSPEVFRSGTPNCLTPA